MVDRRSGLDPVRGPRAEVVLRLRDPGRFPALARSLAVLAATPAVDGVVLVADALIDLGSPLWKGAPFTAVLLGRSDIPDLTLSRRTVLILWPRPSPRPRRSDADEGAASSGLAT